MAERFRSETRLILLSSILDFITTDAGGLKICIEVHLVGLHTSDCYQNISVQGRTNCTEDGEHASHPDPVQASFLSDHPRHAGN